MIAVAAFVILLVMTLPESAPAVVDP